MRTFAELTRFLAGLSPKRLRCRVFKDRSRSSIISLVQRCRAQMAVSMVILAVCSSAPVSVVFADAHEWRRIGIETATKITAFAIDPTTPSTIYAVAYRRVFKTVDGGASWLEINFGVPNSIEINTLVIDPKTPSTLYAGAEDRDETTGAVYKSIDGGKSWNAIGGDQSLAPISALAIDPTIPTTLFSGTDQPEYDIEDTSIYKSTDGSESWSKTGLTYQAILAIVIDPASPSTLYVATRLGEVIKSTDGGEHWRHSIVRGSSPFEIHALAIDPMDPSTLYAGAYSEVYKSTDGGVTWRSLKLEAYYSSFVSLAIDPKTPSVLYAGNNETGVYESTDGGESWHRFNAGFRSLGVYALAIAPTAPFTLYAGTPEGVWAIERTMTSAPK